jgi:predicted ATPase
VLFNQGHVEQALELSDMSLELAERIGGPVTLAQAWGMRSGLLFARGELAQFSEWLARTRLHSAERNIGYWTKVCSLWSAWLQGRAGEPEVGAAVVQEQLDSYRASGGRLALPQFQILLADLRLAGGDTRRALAALAAGQEHIDATGERFSEPDLQRFLGRVLMAGDTPDPAAATAALERAVAAARGQNARLLELRAVTDLAQHQRELGETCSALERVESLCEWFGADSQVPEVARARTLVSGGAALQ